MPSLPEGRARVHLTSVPPAPAPAPAPRALDDAEIAWPDALRRACAGEGLRPVYQPIVDLERGLVAGYEALIRFDTLPGVTPDRWFAAARDHGCEPALEAAALRTTLAGRPDLPPDRFLTVNVNPASLAAKEPNAVIDAEADLRGLVIELTEQVRIESYAELGHLLDRHRDRGALIAVDDAGSGYAGLAHILELRPAILKLDRGLVAGIDRDEAKRALVEMLGIFAGRIDAWVLAEGIETPSELATVRRLGVPLGQGWVLGRPSPPWAEVDEGAQPTLAEPHAPADDDATVRLLVEPGEWVSHGAHTDGTARLARHDAATYVVAIDDDGIPVAGLTAGAVGRGRGCERAVLKVATTTTIAEAARRSLTRPADRRFEPLVCIDAAGRFVGIVRFERIVDWLAQRA